jgi:hypothetical protein
MRYFSVWKLKFVSALSISYPNLGCTLNSNSSWLLSPTHVSQFRHFIVCQQGILYLCNDTVKDNNLSWAATILLNYKHMLAFLSVFPLFPPIYSENTFQTSTPTNASHLEIHPIHVACTHLPSVPFSSTASQFLNLGNHQSFGCLYEMPIYRDHK